MKTIRKTLLATAFIATVFGTLAGAALQGETKEADLAINCAATAWPMIPAACLTNGADQDVRYVTTDNQNVGPKMASRFAIAFQ